MTNHFLNSEANRLFRSFVVPGSTPADVRARKEYVYGLLEDVGRKLEPSEVQRALAQRRYHEVGAWLSAATDPLLHAAEIYTHGSFAIGTTVKPIGRDEFDLDTVYHALGLAYQPEPAALKKSIGDRLRAKPEYAVIIEEKQRCWRLNWPGQFHIDVTPSIPNRACAQGGELVPDKELRRWKETNPRGYAKLFERRAQLVPTSRMTELAKATMDAQVEVKPFPVKQHAKGVLKRLVQLLKRHRDTHFQGREDRLRPISIIITTLAAQSYEYCIRHHPFDTDLDLLVATVQLMPVFIDRQPVNGKPHWLVMNETTHNENFAEKWNIEPDREPAFRQWHARAVADIEALATSVYGNDGFALALQRMFGAHPVKEAMDERAAVLLTAREEKRLSVAPRVGLTTAAATVSTPVRAHTFYGGREP